MPKRSVQQRAGFRGEAFVDKAVSDAGHVWNDTRRDFAIDGQIEFVDTNREVTGVAVLAQVKATEVGFAGDSATGFTFRCEADHIAYWTRLGRPVVLICVDLRVDQAWWKRVDTWFADPKRRAQRVVRFDKAADRFDPDSFSKLSALGVPIGEPLPRLEGSERLVSNLLVIDGFAPMIYEASTPCSGSASRPHRVALRRHELLACRACGWYARPAARTSRKSRIDSSPSRPPAPTGAHFTPASIRLTILVALGVT